MILVKVFVRQLFRIRNSVQIIFTVWTECTFIGEIEETMSLSLFLQGVSLSVFISVNIVKWDLRDMLFELQPVGCG